MSAQDPHIDPTTLVDEITGKKSSKKKPSSPERLMPTEPDAEGWQDTSADRWLVARARLPTPFLATLEGVHPNHQGDEILKGVRKLKKKMQAATPGMPVWGWAALDYDLWAVYRFDRDLTQAHRAKIEALYPSVEWVTRVPTAKVVSETFNKAIIALSNSADYINPDDVSVISVEPSEKLTHTLSALMGWLRRSGHANRVRYNALSQQIELDSEPLSDCSVIRLTERIELETKMGWGVSLVTTAVTGLAGENTYDPVVTWLDSLKWDGVDRLTTFCTRYMAEPNAYHWYIRRWLISAVARQYHPGTPVDLTIVLRGAQGWSKDRFWATLLPNKDWYLEGGVDPGGEGMAAPALILQGKVLINFAEMAKLSKREMDQVKDFLTLTTDTFKRPYDRFATVSKRRCVFVGSTNSATPLVDPTGSRRFAIIDLTGLRCPEECFALLDSERDQVWAQAVALYKAGESWRLNELERAVQSHENQNYVVEHPLYERVTAWGMTQPRGFELGEALEAAGIRIDQADRHAAKLGTYLRSKGFVRGGQQRVSGRVVRLWAHPDAQTTDNRLHVEFEIGEA